VDVVTEVNTGAGTSSSFSTITKDVWVGVTCDGVEEAEVLPFMTHPESATAIMMNATRMQRDPDTVNMIGRDAIKPFFNPGHFFGSLHIGSLHCCHPGKK